MKDFISNINREKLENCINALYKITSTPAMIVDNHYNKLIETVHCYEEDIFNVLSNIVITNGTYTVVNVNQESDIVVFPIVVNDFTYAYLVVGEIHNTNDKYGNILQIFAYFKDFICFYLKNRFQQDEVKKQLDFLLETTSEKYIDYSHKEKIFKLVYFDSLLGNIPK